jgi:hypothetical protein
MAPGQRIAAADSNGLQPCRRNPAIISSKPKDVMIEQKIKHQIKAYKCAHTPNTCSSPGIVMTSYRLLCCTRNPAVISSKPNDVMIQQEIKHQIKAFARNKRVIPGAALKLGSLTSNRLSAPCTRNCVKHRMQRTQDDYSTIMPCEIKHQKKTDSTAHAHNT